MYLKQQIILIMLFSFICLIGASEEERENALRSILQKTNFFSIVKAVFDKTRDQALVNRDNFEESIKLCVENPKEFSKKHFIAKGEIAPNINSLEVLPSLIPPLSQEEHNEDYFNFAAYYLGSIAISRSLEVATERFIEDVASKNEKKLENLALFFLRAQINQCRYNLIESINSGSSITLAKNVVHTNLLSIDRNNQPSSLVARVAQKLYAIQPNLFEKDTDYFKKITAVLELLFDDISLTGKFKETEKNEIFQYFFNVIKNETRTVLKAGVSKKEVPHPQSKDQGIADENKNTPENKKDFNVVKKETSVNITNSESEKKINEGGEERKKSFYKTLEDCKFLERLREFDRNTNEDTFKADREVILKRPESYVSINYIFEQPESLGNLNVLIPLIPPISTVDSDKDYENFSRYYLGSLATIKALSGKIAHFADEIIKAKDGKRKLENLLIFFLQSQINQYRENALNELNNRANMLKNDSEIIEKELEDINAINSPALVVAKKLYSINPDLFTKNDGYMDRFRDVWNVFFNIQQKHSRYLTSFKNSTQKVYENFRKKISEKKKADQGKFFGGTKKTNNLSYGWYALGIGVIGLLFAGKKYQWLTKFQQFLEKYRKK